MAKQNQWFTFTPWSQLSVNSLFVAMTLVPSPLHFSLFHKISTSTSIIVSMFNIFAALGCISAGPVSEKFGRKTTLILFVGTLTLNLSNNFAMMFMARFVIVAGIAFPAPELYASEETPKDLRGITCTCSELCINLSIVIGYTCDFSL